MKKHLKKIIIPIIVLAILIAPISPTFKIENGKIAVKTEIKKAEANPVTVGLTITANTVKDQNGTTFIDVKAMSENGTASIQDYRNLYIAIFPTTGSNPPADGTAFSFQAFEPIPYDSEYTDAEFEAMGCPAETHSGSGGLSLEEWKNYQSYCRKGTIRTLSTEKSGGKYTLLGFEVQFAPPPALPAGDYYYLAFATDGNFDITDILDGGIYYGPILNFIKNTDKLSYQWGTFKLDESGTITVGAETGGSSQVKAYNLECGITIPSSWFKGCLANLFYTVWNLTSSLMELAGKLLDFFLFYSLNSSAYSSVFIQKGWGIIRDVANIFFIIALLYIAIKTILNLNVSNNKKLISSVIIVALIINFSLFATQVIIDGSNILAKVFYNQITTVNEDSTQAEVGAGGEKAIAVNLVKGFNPQKVVNASEAAENVYMYMFIILIMIGLTLYTAYMFFVVSILFVGRVASLWISMIFAPLAFASYSVPFDLMGFGHKNWWNDLLKNAFLAPIFIFFLYIIILFIELGSEVIEVSYGTNTTGSGDLMLKIMGTVIPFAIIFIMLTRAKKLAVEYSGELGAMVSKVGGTIVKVGGGALLGAGAMVAGGVLTRTVGRAGSAVAESKWAKDMASSNAWLNKFIGNKLMSAGKAAGKSSFDIRGAKVMGKSLASTGLKVGAAGTGSFVKAKADKIAKRQQRAKDLEAGHGEKERKDLNKVESNRQGILSKLGVEIEKLDKTIEKSRQGELDAKNRVAMLERTGQKNTPEHANAIEEYKKASNKFTQVKTQKTALREGKDYTDANGTLHKYSETATHDNGNGTRTSIKDFEDDLIPEAMSKLKVLNANRKFGYAKGMDTWAGKTFDYFASGGMNSGIGSNEAAYNIRMDMKLDSGTKTH